MSNQNIRQRKLIVISYVLSVVAISMFVFTTFFSKTKELQLQGIYWFGIGAVCALLPTILPLITKLKLKDFEVEFKEKLDNVEKRVTEIEDAFIKSFESLRREEKDLPPEFIEQRNRQWDRFDEDIQRLDGEELFAAQRDNSLVYLRKFGLTVRDLKERLARLGHYKGNIDDTFSRDLAEAIKKFQRFNNMRHVDGMFGELTFAKMAERLGDIPQQSKD